MGQFHKKNLEGVRLDPDVAAFLCFLSLLPIFNGLVQIFIANICKTIDQGKRYELMKFGFLILIMNSMGPAGIVASLWSFKFV